MLENFEDFIEEEESGAPEDFIFDDCAICQAQKKAILDGKNLSIDELKEAFKKEGENGGIVGGAFFDKE